jgi:flagella basal body P-ring formation protein FlgA
MELPSFYKTFAKNILRHCAQGLTGVQKSAYPVKIWSLGILLLMLGTSGNAQSAGFYSLLQLKQDLTKALGETYRQVPHERIDISVGNLDSRLRIAQCPTPVEFTPQDPTGLGGNISVKAECVGPVKWVVHLPAQVMIYQQVPVAAQDIPRGQTLSEQHLTSATINVSTIRQAYAADNQAVLGREAKRNIGKGDVFRSNLLDAPTSVRRGEVVVLESVAGGIKVSSSGTAMADGRLGQKIRVKNDSSARVVTGIVRGPGLVQTL